MDGKEEYVLCFTSLVHDEDIAERWSQRIAYDGYDS